MATNEKRRASLIWVWGLAAVLIAAESIHNISGMGGRGSNLLFRHWLHDGLLWLAAGLSLIGTIRNPRGRLAWALITTALVTWALGDTTWSIQYAGTHDAPSASFSDILWLSWYPLVVGALALLIRDRVPGFEFHRWIDGIVVMLVVATPWVGLFLEPVAEKSGLDNLGKALEFAYPLGDVILVGGVLGVFAIMAWRPGRMWFLLGSGLVVIGIADAAFSVEALAQSNKRSIFDGVLLIGAFLIAYGSWLPHPGRLEPREMIGWSAIALPLSAQAVAAGVQIYGYYNPLPESERLFTFAVLVIAMVQIIMTRPGRPRAPG